MTTKTDMWWVGIGMTPEEERAARERQESYDWMRGAARPFEEQLFQFMDQVSALVEGRSLVKVNTGLAPRRWMRQDYTTNFMREVDDWWGWTPGLRRRPWFSH